MTDIKQILNNTALSIAKNLDKKDGVEDGKINGSIWNQFVEDKGGNKISENGFISLENARRSITTYLMRNSQKLGQTVKNLADNWLSKEGIEPVIEQQLIDVSQPVEESDPVQGTNPVKKIQETEPVTRPADAPPLHETPPVLNVQKKGKNYSNINLNNIIKAKQIQYKEVVNNRFNGKDIAKQYEKYLSNGGTFTTTANKDNVAYVVDKLFYDNAIKDNVASVNVISSMLKPLMTKAKELKIKTNLTEQSKSLDKSTLAEIKRVASAIIEKDDSIENDYLAFASIKEPATSMAGKKVVDKASGKIYYYDTNGSIKRVFDTSKKRDCLENVSRDVIYIDGNNNELRISKSNGKVRLYHQKQGEYRIKRETNGNLRMLSSNKSDGIDFHFDKNGKFISYVKQSGNTIEIRNPNGDLLAYFKDIDGKRHAYDANGNEVSEFDVFNEYYAGMD